MGLSVTVTVDPSDSPERIALLTAFIDDYLGLEGTPGKPRKVRAAKADTTTAVGTTPAAAPTPGQANSSAPHAPTHVVQPNASTPGSPVITDEQLRAKLGPHLDQFRGQFAALIVSFGAKGLAEVPQDKRAEFLEKAGKIAGADLSIGPAPAPAPAPSVAF